jgi:succinate dehydrogenase/fumarate reductase flavoprotein subunit
MASSVVDAKHDVLIVGAGCAGMRAAIEAHDAGADDARSRAKEAGKGRVVSANSPRLGPA